MSTIKIEGNGNFVFQSHSGSGDNIAGNKINHMTPRQKIQNLVASNKIQEAIEALYEVPGINTNDVALLHSRWSSHKRSETLGVFSFSEASQGQAKIVSAILSYAGCDSDAIQRPIQATHTPQGWEPQLFQIIRENDRKNPEAARRALTLLESFRSYHDLKKTRSFFDRSGEKLQEIQDEFEAFKKTLNKSENESVEKFIDRVASLIDAKIPDWPSIKEAFVLCLGRSGAGSLGSMQIEQLERIIENQPNDDDAKLRIVYSIETFLGQL